MSKKVEKVWENAKNVHLLCRSPTGIPYQGLHIAFVGAIIPIPALMCYAKRRLDATIIPGPSALYPRKMMLSELGVQAFYISADGINHNEVKLFPLDIKIFKAKSGAEMHLLNLQVMWGEYSDQNNINFILSSIQGKR